MRVDSIILLLNSGGFMIAESAPIMHVSRSISVGPTRASSTHFDETPYSSGQKNMQENFVLKQTVLK